MRGFVTLFARELRHYFVTPIACVVIAVFWAASGFFFSFNALFVAAPDMVSAFHNMSLLLMLMMPLVTMRTLAEERSGDTLELLLTLPVGEAAIVAAKYLALLVILVLMLAGSTLAVIPLALYGTPDYGPILGGYLGVFLLGAAFAAVGLAASSCAANQVVAAVLTWALLLLMWFVDYAAALDGAGGAVRWLQHVSFSVQYLDLIRGVLTRGAVVWFGSVIAVGMVVATQVLRARRA
ncbi:MAG: ABC transporter permease [Gammaproteobacteria bacterium]|nr:ABC transporter permease [Gammaproteobacteria bacterium]MCP5199134.1 ABC transporter permease [Gammaproteobacteria bacterium]